ncbi:SDR family NAD(P)-dependent oxidoreductase [Nonomuraea salmonea]|uniref:SDR family NAD(P)-dependent oxidoreductase n=1 Tax=Nonomuraea salmonea TaxID=46181 RepID=UPI002FED6026
MELGLAGKVVLVTGGSGSIGAAMAEAFAAEGAHVALTFRDNAQRAEELARVIGERGGRAMVVKYDLADPAAIRSCVSAVLDEWGRLDVLVLSASAQDGTRTAPVNFEDVPPEEWSPLLRADVEGSFHTVQAVLPAMRRQAWGRIILISANIVARGAPGDEAFVSSKMALHGLGRTLATELAPDGILVNVVAPGGHGEQGLPAPLPRGEAGEVRRAGRRTDQAHAQPGPSRRQGVDTRGRRQHRAVPGVRGQRERQRSGDPRGRGGH